MRRTAGCESPVERPESLHAPVSQTQGEVSPTQWDSSQTPGDVCPTQWDLSQTPGDVSPVRASLHMCSPLRTEAPAQAAFDSERVPRWQPVQGTPQLSPHGSQQGHGKALCVQVLPEITVTEPPPVLLSESVSREATSMMEALSIASTDLALPAGHSLLPCAPHHTGTCLCLVSPPLLAAPDLLLRGPAGLRSDGISSLRVCLRPAHMRLSWAEET